MGVTSLEDVLRCFDECADALSRNGITPWVIRQVVAQLVFFITAYGVRSKASFMKWAVIHSLTCSLLSRHIFNQVIKMPELSTGTVGLSIRFMLSELQRWMSSRAEVVPILECCMYVMP